MSRLGPNQLTARKAETLKDGVHSDGGNLWLTVKGGSRRWSVRYTSPTSGKRREMGLGSFRELSLADAREQAIKARRLLRDGLDPIDEREAAAGRLKAETLTFRAVADLYIAERSPEWRDPRSVPIWKSSLERLAYPYIGDRQIAAVTTEGVLAVLRPIWTTTTETADRLRGRIERILDYASTHGWRQGENPARWRGHLSNILPRPSAVVRVEHHAAIPWSEVGRIMRVLSSAGGTGALAVRFVCLTAARSGEVRSAPWSEIDLKARVWTIPPERMKAKREHRVPLSPGALEILSTVAPQRRGSDSLVFPGGIVGRSLSDVALSKALHAAAGTKEVTVHGLRSTFRDWVAETTDYPGDVAEMALAHTIGDKVEAAYRRGDLFEKRRRMMEEWAKFIAVEQAS